MNEIKNDNNATQNNTSEINHNFKAVPNTANNLKQPKIKKEKTKKEKSPKTYSLGKSVIIPFVSGIIGCATVMGTILFVPEIKKAVFPTSNVISTAPSTNTSSNGTVKQVDLDKYSNTSIYAANKILPSIVGIKVDYTVSSNYYSMFGLSSRPQTSSATASGSGIIISDDGYILTNNHIVASSSSDSFYQVSEANKVTVTLYGDETEYDAKIIGKDEQTDLAVIKIDKTGLTKAEFADSDSIKVGEFAMAVGNPLGMQSSITCGVVSAVNREVTDTEGKSFKLIQTDAAINSGNSGGALVNSEGKVIGVNTLKLSGTGVEGMGFAIPINSTSNITEQLIQYSKVKRPFIGIGGVDLDEKTAKAHNLVVGIYVKTIEDFSAAEKSGIKVGDVIIEVDGKKITKMDELNEIKNSKNIGDELKLKINRNNKEEEITVILGEQP